MVWKKEKEEIAFFQILCVPDSFVHGQEAGKRLIKKSEDDTGKWMTMEEIMCLKEDKIGFFDVTNYDYPPFPKRAKTFEIPTTIRFNSTVRKMIPLNGVDESEEWTWRMERFVLHFSSYYGRYYDDPIGLESQLWLLQHISKMVENYTGNVEITGFDHLDYPQQSLIVKIMGVDETVKNEVIILGAHQDSIAIRRLYAPGADDNGSGCVALLEVLHAIVLHGATFRRTIELHFYAAEEGGLLGSQHVAQTYREQDAIVNGMLNLDVIGYHTEGRDEIAIYTDETDEELTQFQRLLIDEYCEYNWTDKKCGYACSDHAAWTKNGYPSIFASEIKFSDFIHNPYDRICYVDFEQIKQYVKLAIAFVVELAEPEPELGGGGEGGGEGDGLTIPDHERTMLRDYRKLH